ncbi:GH32 C-terminal domain-containing protein [Marinoscillum sp. MHG1-6]|uniref:GH32 C-terminal domain-containing protein n=1 Tax=Marinoscillum sp. MHG1-6 TaxID=2959627 RepID=UPI002157D89F|nr:GH32 C-terminal domain-containing protein [Marinoscillum sp. MHG1-6]
MQNQDRFSFDKTTRTLIDANALPDNDFLILLNQNTNYNIRILIENAMVNVYVNNEVALSNQIYKATGTNWRIFADNRNATFSNINVCVL